jgi:HEPN domain-containing protein
MNTLRVLTRGAVVALAVLMAGCEDGPTLPEGADTEAEAAAALDQEAIQAQALVEQSLGTMPEGPLPEGRRAPIGTRTDSIRTRPDSIRQRPDSLARPDAERIRPDHSRRARLAVALATESLELAERLLEGTDPNPEQLRYLQQAKGYLRRAEQALETGRPGAAIELSEASQIASLKAVVLPRGVTREEARAIHDLAKKLLEQARAELGDDATEIERHLFRLAHELFEAGTRQLANGSVRGVVALWKSAALSSFLIG